VLRAGAAPEACGEGRRGKYGKPQPRKQSAIEKENQTMSTKRSGIGPGTRLETGAAILAAAQVVDTALVKPRLTIFIAAHRSYVGAQGKVDAAYAELRAALRKVTRRDMDLDEAVEALALALANEGKPRINPFATYGAEAPSVVKKMISGDEAQAVHQLVANVQRAKTLSQRTRDAARGAEQAARSVDALLLPVEQLEVNLRDARHQRDTIGQRWDAALAALRRAVRSAADEGADGLYTALFGHAPRPSRKSTKPTPAPAPDPAPAPATGV
jgi:hypothetical protein